MAQHSLRNSGGVRFLIVKGNVVVRKGQRPDGDTIAFASSKAYSGDRVRTNIPVDPNAMTSTNLRFQSIDAPEKSQPMGAKSRDSMLKRLGFKPSELGLGDDDFTAGDLTVKWPAWVATHDMDNYGRPLSYIFGENPGFKHGTFITGEDVRSVLKKSLNYQLALAGSAYPAFYENTDETHAVIFQDASQRARKARRGIWAPDKTTDGFTPVKESLEVGGQLIYPKFYRRIAEWKNSKPSASAFINWLKTHPSGQKLVQGAETSSIPLWKLFEIKSAQKVIVPYDVTRLWFSQ